MIDTFSDSTRDDSGPYNALAAVYDAVMEHVDYRSWARYIASVFRAHELDGRRVLEAACGTGSLAVELHRLGYSVTGFDYSPSMIAEAARKFAAHAMPARLCAADMVRPPFGESFDALVCLYDSINYLTRPGQVVEALDALYGTLRPGGLCVFDVCTVKNSRLFFADNAMVEYFDGIRCERTCRFDAQKRIQENHFVLEHQDTRVSESHYQKIYYLSEMRDMIAETHFATVACYEDMTFYRGTEDSERVHFVLQKSV